MTWVDYSPELLVSIYPHCYARGMGESSGQLVADLRGASRKPPRKQTAPELGRRLLEIIVYKKVCQAGGNLNLDDLEATEIGDWKMPDFKAARAYAASQGWVIVQGDVLTLTTAGLAAA